MNSQEKHKNTQKEAIQLSIKISCVLALLSKHPFLMTCPKKRAPPKHYKNMGFQQTKKQNHLMVTKRPFLDKKPTQKFQL